MPHPNPLTAALVEAHITTANESQMRLSYALWDGETRYDIVISTCVYGFPSVVILDWSIGSGIAAHQWNSYGIQGNVYTKEPHYHAMFEWIAQQVNKGTTGTLPLGHPMNKTGEAEERYGEWKEQYSKEIGYAS